MSRSSCLGACEPCDLAVKWGGCTVKDARDFPSMWCESAVPTEVMGPDGVGRENSAGSAATLTASEQHFCCFDTYNQM